MKTIHTQNAGLFKPVALLKNSAALTLMILAASIHAQDSEDHPDVILHVNPNVGICDFDISSDLTQAEWSQASREIGNILYLNPLSSSKPLGAKNWNLFIEANSANVDQESGAWNNTFQHPDSTHYLTDNGRIKVPGLRFQMGITSKIDAGIHYSPAQPFGARYGFLGLETRYAFLNDTSRNWYASIRASYVVDANIQDFNISSTGLDLTTSKTFFGILTPYAGVAANWNHSREVTSEVNLTNENSLAIHGIFGVDLRWKFLSVGYEFMVGYGFQNRAMRIGVSF